MFEYIEGEYVAKRKNLRYKIYQLKKYITDILERNNTNKCCKESLYSVLEEMCNLFDIPRIEEFLKGGKYSLKKEKEVERRKKSLDEHKIHFRKMLNME